MLIFHSRNCRYLTRSCAVAFPVIMLICLIVPHLAQAAAGDLDSTFGVGGQVTTDLKRRYSTSRTPWPSKPMAS